MNILKEMAKSKDTDWMLFCADWRFVTRGKNMHAYDKKTLNREVTVGDMLKAMK